MFQLTIETDGPAFGQTTAQRNAEVVRILYLMAVRIDGAKPEDNDFPIHDYSGHVIGEAVFVPED